MSEKEPLSKNEQLPVNPSPEDNSAAIYLLDALQLINRARDPHLYTNKRLALRSLEHKLANPDIELEVLADYANMSSEQLKEELKAANEAFKWAADISSGGNNSNGETRGSSTLHS